MTPTLLSLLNQAGAGYRVGLKANQSVLLAQAEGLASSRAEFESRQVEKRHGRVEVRSYSAYRINPLWLEERWEQAGIGIQTVVWVTRERLRQKDGHSTLE